MRRNIALFTAFVAVNLLLFGYYYGYIGNGGNGGSSAVAPPCACPSFAEQQAADAAAERAAKIAEIDRQIVALNLSMECSARGRIGPNGRCHCKAGYRGEQCENVNWCVPGCDWFYNRSAARECYCGLGVEGAPFSSDCLKRSNASCPNDCWGHGVCSDNKCRCDRGFTGDDCSKVHNTKAVITVLCQAWEKERVLRHMLPIDRFFNNMYKYDVIIFQDGMSEADQQWLRERIVSTLIFVTISLAPPPHINGSKVNLDRSVGKNEQKGYMGYRGVMRFYSGLMYKLPEIARYEYYWRLDVDTMIMRPVEYDVFAFMKENKYWYGCIQPGYENHLYGLGKVVYETWPLVRDKYLYPNRLMPLKLRGEYFTWDRDCWEEDPYMIDMLPKCSIYNMQVCNCHFEIGDLNFFRGDDYMGYWNFLDSTDGWYYAEYRDHLVKAMGMAIWMGDTNRWYNFKDIGYWHSYNFNCPDGVIGGEYWRFFAHMVPEKIRGESQW